MREWELELALEPDEISAKVLPKPTILDPYIE